MSIQMTISTMSGLRSRKELTFRMEHPERPAASALDNLFMWREAASRLYLTKYGYGWFGMANCWKKKGPKTSTEGGDMMNGQFRVWVTTSWSWMLSRVVPAQAAWSPADVCRDPKRVTMVSECRFCTCWSFVGFSEVQSQTQLLLAEWRPGESKSMVSWGLRPAPVRRDESCLGTPSRAFLPGRPRSRSHEFFIVFIQNLVVYLQGIAKPSWHCLSRHIPSRPSHKFHFSQHMTRPYHSVSFSPLWLQSTQRSEHHILMRTSHCKTARLSGNSILHYL